MENKGQDIIVCKKCGSNKVNKVPLGLQLFATAGCLMWIPIIGWVLAPIVFLISLLTPFGKIVFKCEECKHQFPVDKETYKQYKEYLRE